MKDGGAPPFEGRLVDAARLAEARGDLHQASRLFERACAFGDASRAALGAREWSRAANLARLGGDPDARDQVLRDAAGDLPLLRRLAQEARDQGDPLGAGAFFEAAREYAQAAAAYEEGADPSRAAIVLERAGLRAEAGRVLTAAFQRALDPTPPGLALAALLLRAGDAGGALRVLQQLPDRPGTRRAALPLLHAAASQLALFTAADALQRELVACEPPHPEAALVPLDLAPPSPSPAGRLFGRYDVVREVATSATARVLECIDVQTSSRVAVKVFAGGALAGAGRDARARFAREAAALATLRHPGIVGALAVGEAPAGEPLGPAALVFRWMAGGTLASLLATTALSPARAVEIAGAVLEALSFAHRHGVLHRDVKPSNVLFDDRGVPQLTDFGTAHIGALGATVTAALLGTLAYMSPEQREGRAATVRSDVYAAGVLLEEMLAPARRASATGLLDRPHEALIAQMTAADPSARPEDARVAHALLRALPWSVAVPAKVPDAAPTPREEARPRVSHAEGARPFDTWLQRAFEAIPLTEGTLARAAVFARAVASGCLQRVLRVDTVGALLWLEEAPAREAPLPLGAAHEAALRSALGALHAAGGAHGALDGSHLRVAPDGGLFVTFPAEEQLPLTLHEAQAADWVAFGALTR